jgi:predicted metalloprotease with PDZ domain
MPRTPVTAVPVLLAALAAALGVPTPCQAQPGPAARMQLEVDATDLDHHLFRVHETLDFAQDAPASLTLHIPRWLPGTHGPFGDANGVAGLKFSAGGQPLAWQRDLVDPYAFHVPLPAGTRRVELEFQRLTATEKDNGHLVMAPEMLDLEWDEVALYPDVPSVHQLPVGTRLKLPAGWQWGSSLRGQQQPDGWWQFEPLSFDLLVDAPLVAGRHHKLVPLDPPGTARPVVLHLFADQASQLQFSDAQLQAHRRLVEQADRLFRSRHYRHYDFLLWQSDTLGGEGLEHHESSEDGVKPGYFKDWDKALHARGLLPHEYTHSWNGKFRRPADLTTPDFHSPMRDTLLWVYEGQTQYWGRVLTARAGLATPEQARESLAYAAAWAEQRAGHAWRNLQDTTNQATLGPRGESERWADWQRSYDYYDESALIWLDADTLIRERTGGKRSLDDFAATFFGVDDGALGPKTYTFDDVVAALNSVLPHDWRAFLRERLDRLGRAPLDGLARSGWQLVYDEHESDQAKAEDEERKVDDFSYSIGLKVDSEEHKLAMVSWDSPAFRAGLAPGAKLLAVNGMSYKPERLADAIRGNRDGSQPIELLVQDGEHFRSVRIDYRGGLRYPHLKRLPNTPDRLSAIFSPR